MNDPYATLGINPGATDKEIKAAFKKLAKKHHPDVGGNEVKFKEINEAYSFLTDKKEETFPGGFGGGNYGFNDIFNESMFDSIFRRAGSRVINRISVDPELLIKGGTFDYQFQTFENRGGGVTPVRKTATIRVEADTPAGVQIAVPGTQPNHVFLQLVPGNTEKYRVSDMVHLTEVHKIDIFKAMVGGEVEVKTPNGRTVSVKIPPGTQYGTIHRIRAGGLKHPNGQRGDYNIQVVMTIPSIVGETEEDIREKLLASMTEGIK
jgi:curved DNA-binding protein